MACTIDWTSEVINWGVATAGLAVDGTVADAAMEDVFAWLVISSSFEKLRILEIHKFSSTFTSHEAGPAKPLLT